VEVAKVTSKGQITIPISIRRKLEINEGDKVLFIYKPDGVLMVNPVTYQGGSAGDVVDVAESEMAAEAVAAMKERSAAKTPPAVPEPAPTVAAAESNEIKTTSEEAEDSSQYNQKAAPRPIPPAPLEPEKPQPSVAGLNLGTLLDDIRSIGSNI